MALSVPHMLPMPRHMHLHILPSAIILMPVSEATPAHIIHISILIWEWSLRGQDSFSKCLELSQIKKKNTSQRI